MENADLTLTIIGRVSSPLKTREECPRQGFENAPEAEIEIFPSFLEGLDGMEPGRDIFVFTWLHQADRSILKVRPGETLTLNSRVFSRPGRLSDPIPSGFTG